MKTLNDWRRSRLYEEEPSLLVPVASSLASLAALLAFYAFW